MEKKFKLKLIFNIFLFIVFTALVVTLILVGAQKFKDKKQKEQGEQQIELKEVGYGSTVDHVGYRDAGGVSKAFISAFNNNSGEELASMMNLPSEYIFDYITYELEQEGVAEENLYDETVKRFDARYEEIMQEPSQFKDFILMQYEMATKEEEIIGGMPAVAPTVTLLNEPEIKDITKYLSTIDLEVHLEIPSQKINQKDTVQLLLLHRDGTYYLMRYTQIASENL